jgi:ribosomal protein S19E (S16A)
MEAGNGQPPDVTVTAPAVEEYEPKFDRIGTERRVLGHVTDEDHVGRGPRNTAERLSRELAEDPYTDYHGSFEMMQHYLDVLEGAGLLEKREDGTYAVTESGRYELTH